MEYCVVIQRDHNTLERWTSRNLTKFNNGKHRREVITTYTPV